MIQKPFQLTSEQKSALDRISRKYNIRFVILHGSYAKGFPHIGSDLDIAVVGNTPFSFDTILELFGPFGTIFGNNQNRELDLKTLHGADPLFRYLVAHDGILLYGDITDFNEFKAYAARAYEDSKKLFHLEEIMVKKHNAYLLSLSQQHA